MHFVKLTRVAIVVFAVVHLSLLFFHSHIGSSIHIPKKVRDVVLLYNWCTGGTRYDFFGPKIGHQLVAKCYVLQQDNSLTEEIIGGADDAAQFRISNVIQTLNPTLAPEVGARIVARYCFQKYRKAKCVRITFGYFEMDTDGEGINENGFHFTPQSTGTYIHE